MRRDLSLPELLKAHDRDIQELKSRLAASPSHQPYVWLRYGPTSTAAGNTSLPWATATHNPDGWWTSGAAITPDRPGLYQVDAVVDASQSWSGNRIRIAVLKNGSSVFWERDTAGPADGDGQVYTVTGFVSLNGSTDTTGVMVFNGTGGNRLVEAEVVVRLVGAPA